MITDRFDLTIGGLHFVADLPRGLELVEEDPNYRAFLGGEPPTGEIRLPVRLELGEAPETHSLPVLFDTEQTWSAMRDGEDILLKLRSETGGERFLWVARLPADAASVTIHCGALLVERSGDHVRLTNPLRYPLDQLLTAFVLAPRHGLVVHAAGISRGDRGIFLAGRSGAGKSTVMRLLADRREVTGLSDDRVVVRRVVGSTLVYGTPWAGEAGVATHRNATLAAIVFLRHAATNELSPIPSREAIRQLIPTTSILWFDRQRMEQALQFCEELVEQIPTYELRFRPEPDALKLLDRLL